MPNKTNPGQANRNLILLGVRGRYEVKARRRGRHAQAAIKCYSAVLKNTVAALWAASYKGGAGYNAKCYGLGSSGAARLAGPGHTAKHEGLRGSCTV